MWRFGNTRCGRSHQRGFAEQIISEHLLLGRFGPPTLPQTHSRASAVLVNEFDAGSFQSAANSQVIGCRH
jgi:hypothetical protein